MDVCCAVMMRRRQPSQGGVLLLQHTLVKRMRASMVAQERMAFRTADESTFGSHRPDAEASANRDANKMSTVSYGLDGGFVKAEATAAALAAHVADARRAAVNKATDAGLPVSGPPAFSCPGCARGFAARRDLASHQRSRACPGVDYALQRAGLYERGDGGVVVDWQAALSDPAALWLGVSSQGQRLLRRALVESRRIRAGLSGTAGLPHSQPARRRGAGPRDPQPAPLFEQSPYHDATLSLTVRPVPLFLTDSARGMVAARETLPRPYVGVMLPPPALWALDLVASSPPPPQQQSTTRAASPIAALSPRGHGREELERAQAEAQGARSLLARAQQWEHSDEDDADDGDDDDDDRATMGNLQLHEGRLVPLSGAAQAAGKPVGRRKRVVHGFVV